MRDLASFRTCTPRTRRPARTVTHPTSRRPGRTRRLRNALIAPYVRHVPSHPPSPPPPSPAPCPAEAGGLPSHTSVNVRIKACGGGPVPAAKEHA
ncbi:predicted protein [Streptomyces sp. SPB78]|nr:predicted protein [Streptomyces sp. SPB78]